MPLPRPVQILCAAILFCGAALGAHAQSVAAALSNLDSQLGNYNLITFGNTTLNSYGDTQGPLAIGGNLTLTGSGSIADQSGTFGLNGDPTLYVAGNLSMNATTQLNSGYASLPGLTASQWSWSSTNKDLTDLSAPGNTSQSNLNVTNAGSGEYSTTNPITNPGPTNFNFSTIQSNLQSDSSTLAGATANGTTVIAGTIGVSSGNLTLTPSTTPATGSTVVFTLNTANLNSTGTTYDGSSISNIQINVPTGVNYVVNVVVNPSETTLFGSGANFNSGSNDGNLVWNIEGSTPVTLGGGSFYGAVLAPSTTVTTVSNTTMNGQISADAFNETGAELHFVAFNAAAVIVPEPATFALWGAALCGAAVMVRRVRLSRTGRQA